MKSCGSRSNMMTSVRDWQPLTGSCVSNSQYRSYSINFCGPRWKTLSQVCLISVFAGSRRSTCGKSVDIPALERVSSILARGAALSDPSGQGENDWRNLLHQAATVSFRRLVCQPFYWLPHPVRMCSTPVRHLGWRPVMCLLCLEERGWCFVAVTYDEKNSSSD